MSALAARAAGSAVALLLAAGGAVAESPGCPAEGVETAGVKEVIDGDTISLEDGRVVRLAGIDAPMRPLAQAEPTFPLADRARAALKALLAGEPVRLASVGAEPDRYGRVHGYLWLSDGRSVQIEMVTSGLARVHWFPEETKCFQGLLGAEAEARGAGRGLWIDPDFSVKSAQDSSLGTRNGLYELVEGRVISVGRGSRMVFLDFGRNIRHDFTVMVPPPVAERMAAAGVAADKLAGRRIRVRGIVVDSGGPAIRLNDPAEIELIE